MKSHPGMLKTNTKQLKRNSLHVARFALGPKTYPPSTQIPTFPMQDGVGLLCPETYPRSSQIPTFPTVGDSSSTLGLLMSACLVQVAVKSITTCVQCGGE